MLCVPYIDFRAQAQPVITPLAPELRTCHTIPTLALGDRIFSLMGFIRFTTKDF